MRLQLIGGGKMGQALTGGLLAAEWAEPTELAIAEVDRLDSRSVEQELASLYDLDNLKGRFRSLATGDFTFLFNKI